VIEGWKGRGRALSPFVSSRLVVIHNLHFVSAVVPKETHTPLVVDADTPPSRPVPLEEFEAVAGRGSKVLHPGSPVELIQLAAGGVLNIPRKDLRLLSPENPLRFAAFE
jgi:hypothetical protein